MPLLVIGLNHKTANIDIREKLSISPDEISQWINSFCQYEDIKSCAIISTCNRLEFYLDCDDCDKAFTHFCENYKLVEDETKSFIYQKQGLRCIQHLFEVSSGIDSMILGETQILGQVKSAYEIAKQHQGINKVLDRLFQSAFRVAKTVRSRTDIGKNPVSIANSAVKLSTQIFGELSQQKILLIGAGATSELLLRYLQKHDYRQLAICNRSTINAQKLAKQFNAKVYEFSQLKNIIADYDLIFTATAAKNVIIDSSMIKQAIAIRKHKPMVIIDIAIPRDVDIAVKKFNDIFYYEVDDLQKVISKNIENRQQAAIRAKQIIEVEAESFCYWLKGQQHTQLIHEFQKETAIIRKQSLDKALSQLKKGDQIEDILFQLANNLTKKLNHKPVKAIRSAIQSGDENLIENIKQLLDLNNQANSDT